MNAECACPRMRGVWNEDEKAGWLKNEAMSVKRHAWSVLTPIPSRADEQSRGIAIHVL